MVFSFLSGAGYIIVILVVVLCVGGLTTWWFYNKNQYRFIFRLYSRDMKNSEIVKAKIKTDRSNKKFRYFVFKNNNTRLEIEEPAYFEAGKPVREITYDTTGDYIYIKGKEVDDKDYLKYRLKPTHKTIYLQGLKDYSSKYPLMDKMAMVAFGGLIIVGIFLVIGFIYTFATNVQQAKNIEAIAKTNNQIATQLVTVSSSMEQTGINIYRSVNMMYNGTINRPLPSK